MITGKVLVDECVEHAEPEFIIFCRQTRLLVLLAFNLVLGEEGPVEIPTQPRLMLTEGCTLKTDGGDPND